MRETLLEARHLRVEFGDLVAVDDLSFELAAGDLIGLVGPNGAGKTTTLRALAGLLPTTAGTVRILGYDVLAEGRDAMPNIGFASDTPPLYEKLTVEEYLTFIGKAYRLDAADIDDRIGFWLDQLWLAERRHARIRTLSRGMKQRLAVARALLPNPHVILLDEPAAGLDPGGRVAFRRLLSNLRDQGKAIVISSHILADLGEYCTHIGIMSHGRFIEYGTVRDVAAGKGNHRCRYRITLAAVLSDAAARLAAIDGIDALQVDREEVFFEFRDDRAEAAALLQRLIAAGLPVASFSPMAPGLEEAYLRSGVRQVD
ncbi:MAG: ABC transporter ATP-binding protein [Phycisphaerae bacterium]|nr:ABC transporter ATP-binding protein [Phycisphaerae bacterium]